MCRGLLTLLALSMLAPQAGKGQLVELQPGARVRLTAPPVLGARFDGVIAARRGDTLSLLRSGLPRFDLTIGQLATVELFRGNDRGNDRGAGARRGALWGASIGLVLGTLAAMSSDPLASDCSAGGQCDETTDLEGAMIFTLVGAGYGVAFGAWKGRERWEPLETPRRVSEGRAPSRARRVRLGARLAF